VQTLVASLGLAAAGASRSRALGTAARPRQEWRPKRWWTARRPSLAANARDVKTRRGREGASQGGATTPSSTA
jgi:hypothetical protein